MTHVTYVEKVWFFFIGNLRHSGPLDTETFARALEVSRATVGVPDGR